MGDIQDYLVWKHENKKEVFHCGECLCFTHEMTDGDGICFLDNSLKYCGDVACDSFEIENLENEK